MIIPGVTKGKGIFIPQDPMKIKRDIKSSGDLVIPDICLENVPKVKDIVIPDAPKKVVPKVLPNKGKGMYYNPPQKQQQRGYAPQPAYNKGGYQRQQYAPQPAYNKGGYQKGYAPQPAYNKGGYQKGYGNRGYAPQPAYNKGGYQPNNRGYYQ